MHGFLCRLLKKTCHMPHVQLCFQSTIPSCWTYMYVVMLKGEKFCCSSPLRLTSDCHQKGKDTSADSVKALDRGIALLQGQLPIFDQRSTRLTSHLLWPLCLPSRSLCDGLYFRSRADLIHMVTRMIPCWKWIISLYTCTLMVQWVNYSLGALRQVLKWDSRLAHSRIWRSLFVWLCK